MANGCRQCFGRNGTAEARSKHGDLFRRQYSLALLVLSLALGMARSSSCMAPGLDRHSESHRPSTGC